MAEMVLIVEDDSDIAEILRLYLEGAGYMVLTAANGAEGLEVLRTHDVSCILLDLMMPVMNGFDFLKQMRATNNAPVIVLSARSQSADKMLSLDIGADGFITKPFDSMEVIAYVKAAIRRYRTMGGPVGADGVDDSEKRPPTLAVGRFELSLEELVLRKDGVPIPLTAFELKIMARFMSAPGRVFTKAQLYEAATGESYDGAQDAIMVHISNIRMKIEDDPSHPSAIVTVRGLGYRFGTRG